MLIFDYNFVWLITTLCLNKIGWHIKKTMVPRTSSSLDIGGIFLTSSSWFAATVLTSLPWSPTYHWLNCNPKRESTCTDIFMQLQFREKHRISYQENQKYLIKGIWNTSFLSLNCATSTAGISTHLSEIIPCVFIHFFSHESPKVATVDPVLVANAHRWKIQLGKESLRKVFEIQPLTWSRSWLML